MNETAPFEGYPADTLRFLRELRDHNNRPWFQENKQRYETAIMAPSLALIAALVKPLARLSPLLRVEARRTGGSLMRIYRDTRFAKNKMPYKLNIGIHFRHQSGTDAHAPGYYIHIEPGQVFLGAGTWRPDTATAHAIRAAIADQPTRWKRAVHAAKFRKHYDLQGDSLKRPPRGYDPQHPLIDDLMRKDFIGVSQLSDRAIQSPEFARHAIERFQAAKPLMKFLCSAIEQPF